MKKYLTLFLALLMVFTLFTACSQTEDPAPNDSDSGNVTDDGGSGTDDDGDSGEIVELEFYGLQWAEFNFGPGTVAEKIENEINAILEAEVGARLNFHWLSFSDYSNQITLAVANQERIDLASFNYAFRLPQAYAAGIAMDITDYLAEYATETTEMMDWIMDMASFDGRYYGVPAYRLLNASQYAIFRRDVLEQAGAYEDAQNMTTWADMENILAAITENTDTYGLGQSGGTELIWYGYNLKNGDNIADTVVRETLGDSYGVIVADEDGTVHSAFDDERAAEGFKMVADWYNKGYIYPESPYSTESNKVLLSMTTFGSMWSGSEFGVEANYAQTVGTECYCFKLWNNVMNGSAASGIGAFVPTTAQEPAKAVEVINEIWNNAELCNLFAWGIEGETYVVNDGVATYPEGKDAGSTGYRQNDWGWGNQFLVTPWEPSTADFRELAMEDMNNATKSNFLGFVADLSEANNLSAALAAVKSEYLLGLGCGVYTDDLYAEFLEKLDAAGLQDYIDLFQTQLDEFMA